MAPRRSSFRSRLIASTLICVLAFLSTPNAHAQGRQIPINHDRIEIASLLKLVAEANERTILFDEKIRGTVSIVAKRKVSEDEAWSILESSLAVLGFTLIPAPAGIWRVARIADAVGEAPFAAEVTKKSESYVTALIPLSVADPARVMEVLKPLAGSGVTIVIHEHTRSLIASGPERQIARLIDIADAIDRIDRKKTHFRVLRYRAVDAMAVAVTEFLRSDGIQRDRLEVWTDERTSSLIYRGGDEDVRGLTEFVDLFDQPRETSGEIRVLKVLNRDAEELAEMIRGLRGDARPKLGALGDGPPVLARLRRSDYSITADPATRSLIVSTSHETHRAIQEIVELLDQPPQLVAVDLKVMELRTPTSFSSAFAVNIPLSTGSEQGDVIARLVSVPAGGGLAASPGPDSTIFGRVDQELNVPFLFEDGSGVAVPISNTGVVTAGALSARTEILIQPSLVVTVGDRHELFVGNNVPVPVSGGDTEVVDSPTSTAVSALQRRTTFERKDIGIKLGIEVQASKEGPIQLALDVEISELAPSLAGPVALVGPTFVQQKFIANARLRDGEAAIIAVNRNKRETTIEAGTPFLSAIPFIGWFFRSTVERVEDTHLVLSAQARRIGSPAELAADTIRRRLAFERQNARSNAMPRVHPGDPPYAVLVTTRSRLDDAEALAQGFELQGYAAEVKSWKLDDEELFDVYLTTFESLSDAASAASALSEEGWLAELKMLPSRS